MTCDSGRSFRAATSMAAPGSSPDALPKQIPLGKAADVLFSCAGQMKLPRPVCLFLLFWRAVSSLIAAEEEEIQIDAVEPGEAEWNTQTEVFTTTNRFVARYKGAVLTARRLQGDARKGDFIAEG